MIKRERYKKKISTPLYRTHTQKGGLFIERDRIIEEERGVTNLKRFFDGSAFIEILALVEFISCSIRQAGIQSDIFLVVRERPKCNPQLEWLRNGLPSLFHYLKGNMGRNDTRTQLSQR